MKTRVIYLSALSVSFSPIWFARQLTAQEPKALHHQHPLYHFTWTWMRLLLVCLLLLILSSMAVNIIAPDTIIAFVCYSLWPCIYLFRRFPTHSAQRNAGCCG